MKWVVYPLIIEMSFYFLSPLFLRAPYYSYNGYDLDRLQEILAGAAFRNAIWLASPSFYKILEIKEFDFNRLSQKEQVTLYKYYNRMCFRPTPFGSFATFSSLEWKDDSSPIKLSANAESILHLLPDHHLLLDISSRRRWTESDLLIKNPTIYRLGSNYRFIRSQPDQHGKLIFEIRSFPADKINNAILNIFKKRPVQTSKLLKNLVDLAQTSLTEAKEFVDYLLNEQFLYCRATAGVIGEYPLAGKLDDERTRSFWEKSKYQRLCDQELLEKTSRHLQVLLSRNDDSNNEQYFYGSLEKKVLTGGPGRDVQEELLSAAHLLSRLSVPSQSVNMTEFITQFKNRYDLQKVPILQALDPDVGIYYGTKGATALSDPLLTDIRFPDTQSPANNIHWTGVHQLLLKRWMTDTHRGAYDAIQLFKSDLEGIPENKEQTATSISIMFRQTEDHIVIEYLGGGSPVALIGRFSAFSDEMLEMCKKVVTAEIAQHPQLIYADIGQLSHLHVDNINRRMPIYPFEIPINTFPLEYDNCIFLEDILIYVRGEELILESVKYSERIMPRLATAYNHINNDLPIFRLLCDLQYQSFGLNMNLDPERFFPGLDFYPRVITGNTILSLAKWYLINDVFSPLLADGVDELQALRSIRRKYHLPQKVVFGDTDQQLVFDLGNRHECIFFKHCIKGSKRIKLVEHMPAGRSVQSGSEAMTSQYIAFLSNNQQKSISAALPKKTGVFSKKRTFLLGSDWLYIKLYCTEVSADVILTEIVLPILRQFKPHINAWFFIRYNDPEFHLRLRFHASIENLPGILRFLEQKIEKNKNKLLVKEYKTDTYQREMERYGVVSIELVESIFCAGSNLILFRLAAIRKKVDVPEEFLTGMASAYEMAKCFFAEDQLLEFIKRQVEAFTREFSVNKDFKIEMDKRYRIMRPAIISFLKTQSSLPPGLKKSFSNLFAAVNKIAAYSLNFSLEIRINLIADLIHMQLNRTFQVNQRQKEFLVYFCLLKYIESKIAKKESSGN